MIAFMLKQVPSYERWGKLLSHLVSSNQDKTPQT